MAMMYARPCSSAQRSLFCGDSTGKERDAETGLDYFLARYYSGAQARFLSPDEFKGGPDDAITGKDISQPGPLPYADISNPQSLNKYACTYNNPLRYTDPDGHEILDWFKDAGCHLGATSFCGHGLSKKGVDFIARHEGFKNQVYLDVAGNATIGYGHQIKKNPRTPIKPTTYETFGHPSFDLTNPRTPRMK
jgi:RHS repeat-associated protein